MYVASDGSDANAEEAEVNRLESKKAAIMKKRDFGLDELDDAQPLAERVAAASAAAVSSQRSTR